jgi:hypothetical protein
MTVEFQDVLKVDLVLVGIDLLNDPAEINTFADSVRTDVDLAVPVLAPVTTPDGSMADLGRVIRLNRDRIVLRSLGDRTIIGREFPSGLGDLARLSEVASHAINHTDLVEQTLRAHGYNIDLVYGQTSGLTATQYLAERLFPSKPLAGEGMQLVGGGGKIDLQGDDRIRWRVTVEPRHNNETETRVYLSVNMHVVGQMLPDEGGIAASLKTLWNQARNFALLLDRDGK